MTHAVPLRKYFVYLWKNIYICAVVGPTPFFRLGIIIYKAFYASLRLPFALAAKSVYQFRSEGINMFAMLM